MPRCHTSRLISLQWIALVLTLSGAGPAAWSQTSVVVPNVFEGTEAPGFSPFPLGHQGASLPLSIHLLAHGASRFLRCLNLLDLDTRKLDAPLARRFGEFRSDALVQRLAFGQHFV